MTALKKWLNETFGWQKTILFEEEDIVLMIDILEHAEIDHYHIRNWGQEHLPRCWVAEFYGFEKTYWYIVSQMAYNGVKMIPDTAAYTADY